MDFRAFHARIHSPPIRWTARRLVPAIFKTGSQETLQLPVALGFNVECWRGQNAIFTFPARPKIQILTPLTPIDGTLSAQGGLR